MESNFDPMYLFLVSLGGQHDVPLVGLHQDEDVVHPHSQDLAGQ